MEWKVLSALDADPPNRDAKNDLDFGADGLGRTKEADSKGFTLGSKEAILIFYVVATHLILAFFLINVKIFKKIFVI